MIVEERDMKPVGEREGIPVGGLEGDDVGDDVGTFVGDDPDGTDVGSWICGSVVTWGLVVHLPHVTGHSSQM